MNIQFALRAHGMEIAGEPINLAGYEEEKKKLRPVVLADGTIIDANNMDEQLLLDYFMEFVYNDPSDMASYDAFERWRRDIYGLTKKEERWNYLRDSGEFIVKGNYSDKALGSAVSQQILDGEIDWTRVVVDGTFTMVMEGVLWG